MARKASQAGVSAPSPESPAVKTKPLTWHQERFIEEYIRNGCHGTHAYYDVYKTDMESARTNAARLLANDRIKLAIDRRKQKMREDLNFTLDEAMRIQLGMIRGKQSDFTKVMRDPTKKKNYTGLGDLEHAIESVEKVETISKEGVRCVTKLKLVSKKAIIDNVIATLGLDKGSDKSGGETHDTSMADSARRIIEDGDAK